MLNYKLLIYLCFKNVVHAELEQKRDGNDHSAISTVLFFCIRARVAGPLAVTVLLLVCHCIIGYR